MFIKLRNRFLLLNMCITTVVMLAAFGVIYGITFSNVRAADVRRLSEPFFTLVKQADLPVAAIERTTVPAQQTVSIVSVATGLSAAEGTAAGEIASGTAAAPIFSIAGSAAAGQAADVVFSAEDSAVDVASLNTSLIFTLRLNERGDIISKVSAAQLPDSLYDYAAKRAFASEKLQDTVTIEGRRWLYSVQPISDARLVTSEAGYYTLSPGETQFRATFLDISASEKTLRDLLMTFALVAIVMLFVIFFISLFFANRAIRPLSAAWDRQRQFVSDASHELKSPLAFIDANADALLCNPNDTVAGQRRWVDIIKAETARMSRLVSDLLCLARTEETASAALCVPLDFSELVADCVATVEALIYERDLSLCYDIAPCVTLCADGERLRQLLLILLDNAAKYADPDSEIELRLKESRGRAVLTLENAAAHLQQGDLEQLFDRFYRGDRARSHDGGGYGLGLSIARALAESMEGRLWARRQENGRVAFVLSMNTAACGKPKIFGSGPAVPADSPD